MDVLLTETVTPRAREAADALRAAGHVVHHCHDSADVDAACVALHGEHCPLETEPIDVVVTVRPANAPKPTALEDGVLCGVKRKVPVVVAGAMNGDPFRRWETVAWPGTDVTDVVARVVDSPMSEHTAVATETFRRTLALHGVEADVSATVARHLGGLHVVLDADPALLKAYGAKAAVRVAQVLRDVDPWARGIDVAYARHPQG